MRQKSLRVKRVSERVGLSGSLASLDWPFSTLGAFSAFILCLCFLISRRNNRKPSAFYFFFLIQFGVMGRTYWVTGLFSALDDVTIMGNACLLGQHSIISIPQLLLLHSQKPLQLFHQAQPNLLPLLLLFLFLFSMRFIEMDVSLTSALPSIQHQFISPSLSPPI